MVELRSQLEAIRLDLPVLQAHGVKDRFDAHVLSRLRIALENGEGCWLLAQSELTVPMITVGRSLFESLLATYWGSLSDVNATILIEAEEREGKRILRNLLKQGRAALRDRVTQVEASEQETDELVSGAKRPPRFDQMASDARIKNIYDSLYPFLSLFAHGTATDLLQGLRTPATIAALLPAASALLKGLHLIASRHIRLNTTVSQDELAGVLNVRLAV